MDTRQLLKHSAATRKRLTGRPRAERDEELSALLDRLAGAQAPLTALLKSGPLTGRSLRHPKERELSAQLQSERKKVRDMLRRSPGGQKAKRAEPYAFLSFRGSIGAISRAVPNFEKRLRHSLPQHQKGTHEYREQAQDLLDDIERQQRLLRSARAKATYWSTQPRPRGWMTKKGLPSRESGLIDKAEELSDALSKLRDQARRAVAAPIKLNITRTGTSPKVKRRKWAEETAEEAMLAFTIANKRPPRAVDFRGNPDLPSYSKVHELFGGIPTDSLQESLDWELARSKQS